MVENTVMWLWGIYRMKVKYVLQRNCKAGERKRVFRGDYPPLDRYPLALLPFSNGVSSSEELMFTDAKCTLMAADGGIGLSVA